MDNSIDYTTFRNTLRLLIDGRNMNVKVFYGSIEIPHAAVSRCSAASEDDRRVIRVILSKYGKEDEHGVQ